MWDCYCRPSLKGGGKGPPDGLVIQTTWRRLQHALLDWQGLVDVLPGQKVFLRHVSYVDHWTDSDQRGFDEHVFFKARCYADEREIRLAIRRYDAGSGDAVQAEKEINALPTAMRLPVDLKAIAERVILNPFANEIDRVELAQVIRKFQPSLRRRVKESRLESLPVPVLPVCQ